MARTPPTRALAAGVVDAGSMSAGVIDATTVRVGFPVQNLLGNYSLQDAPTLTNFCLPLAQNFTGTFSITLPTISGTVSDTNAHLSPM